MLIDLIASSISSIFTPVTLLYVCKFMYVNFYSDLITNLYIVTFANFHWKHQ